MPKLKIVTFGCQANELDSQRIAGVMAREGYTLTEDAAEADLIILNGCSIREKAEQKLFSRLGTLQALKAENPRLREELDRIGRALRPLGGKDEVVAPSGLAERTIQRVLRQRLSELWTPSAPSRWRPTDLAVAASILIVLSMVVFPALGQSRQRKILAECSNHLRTIGVALENYSTNFAHYYPYSSSSGPLGVVGMYAPILLESGYVSDAATFVCPGSEDDPCALPRPSQLRDALDDIDRLASLAPSLGGSYGYSLGVRHDGVYYAPRRGRVAGQLISADRPVRPSMANVARSNSPNHGGAGQNTLFLDGHVEFRTSPRTGTVGDNIFVNQKERVEPGLDWDDSVIGSSEARR